MLSHSKAACQHKPILWFLRGSTPRVVDSALGRSCARSLFVQELRRVRSGIMGEKDNMTTMHDVLDAQASRDVILPVCAEGGAAGMHSCSPRAS